MVAVRDEGFTDATHYAEQWITRSGAWAGEVEYISLAWALSRQICVYLNGPERPGRKCGPEMGPALAVAFVSSGGGTVKNHYQPIQAREAQSAS